MFFWISLCLERCQEPPMGTTESDLWSYLSQLSVCTELFLYVCTTLDKVIHPAYDWIPPWYSFIKVHSNKQTHLYHHVFKVTPTCYIFWVFLSCPMRPRLAEFLNIQPISVVSLGNKWMCSSFFSFRLNKTFSCANSQQMTIWHLPDDAGIRTEDLFLLFKEKKKNQVNPAGNFANRICTHTEMIEWNRQRAGKCNHGAREETGGAKLEKSLFLTQNSEMESVFYNICTQQCIWRGCSGILLNWSLRQGLWRKSWCSVKFYSVET